MAKTLRNKISGFMVGSGRLALMAGVTISVCSAIQLYGPRNKLELMRQIKKDNPQMVFNDAKYQNEINKYSKRIDYGLYTIFGSVALVMGSEFVNKRKQAGDN